MRRPTATYNRVWMRKGIISAIKRTQRIVWWGTLFMATPVATVEIKGIQLGTLSGHIRLPSSLLIFGVKTDPIGRSSWVIQEEEDSRGSY